MSSRPVALSALAWRSTPQTHSSELAVYNEVFVCWSESSCPSGTDPYLAVQHGDDLPHHAHQVFILIGVVSEPHRLTDGQDLFTDVSESEDIKSVQSGIKLHDSGETGNQIFFV